ncbi:unnamed protein product, partial [Tetraodon nigroviridis]
VALAFTSKLERALELPCDSGQFTSGGECCLQCPPGEGVVRGCGATQTVCGQCLDSEYLKTHPRDTHRLPQSAAGAVINATFMLIFGFFY